MTRQRQPNPGNQSASPLRGRPKKNSDGTNRDKIATGDARGRGPTFSVKITPTELDFMESAQAKLYPGHSRADFLLWLVQSQLDASTASPAVGGADISEQIEKLAADHRAASKAGEKAFGALTAMLIEQSNMIRSMQERLDSVESAFIAGKVSPLQSEKTVAALADATTALGVIFQKVLPLATPSPSKVPRATQEVARQAASKSTSTAHKPRRLDD